MPTGDVHFQYYKLGYWGVIPVCSILTYTNWELALGGFVGYWIGRYVDPDWDLMGTSSSEGRMVNELWLVGHILFGISSTYGSIFRRFHRSWLTHFPILSTFIRLTFLFSFPISYLKAYEIDVISDWLWFWFGVWMGLSFSDGIHSYLDWRYTDGT